MSCLTKKEFKKICEQQIQLKLAYCYLCGKPILKIQDYNIDHKTPSSRGGADAPSNWMPVHRSCNIEKGALTIDEYRQFIYLKAKRDGRIK
jgi:5-methylcytosine-specific restriction endonuclease McrA